MVLLHEMLMIYENNTPSLFNYKALVQSVIYAHRKFITFAT